MPDQMSMNDEEYRLHISSIAETLDRLRAHDIELGKTIIGESLLLQDLFFLSSVDRNARLIDGFIPAVRAKNLTCAAPLLRLQIDNCLRTYAAFLVDDPNSFSQKVLLDGERVSRIKDRDRQRMTDHYLQEKLSSIDPKVKDAYETASGFIHLSDRALLTMADARGEYNITLSFCSDIGPKLNKPLVECGVAFVHFTRLHQELLKKVAASKADFDEKDALGSGNSE